MVTPTAIVTVSATVSLYLRVGRCDDPLAAPRADLSNVPLAPLSFSFFFSPLFVGRLLLGDDPWHLICRFYPGFRRGVFATYSRPLIGFCRSSRARARRVGDLYRACSSDPSDFSRRVGPLPTFTHDHRGMPGPAWHRLLQLLAHICPMPCPRPLHKSRRGAGAHVGESSFSLCSCL